MRFRARPKMGESGESGESGVLGGVKSHHPDSCSQSVSKLSDSRTLFFTDSLTPWLSLSDSLTLCLSVSLTLALSDSCTLWPTDSLIDSLTDWLTQCLTNCTTDWLFADPWTHLAWHFSVISCVLQDSANTYASQYALSLFITCKSRMYWHAQSFDQDGWIQRGGVCTRAPCKCQGLGWAVRAVRSHTQ